MPETRTQEQFRAHFNSIIDKNGSVPKSNPELGKCFEWKRTMNRGYGRVNWGGRRFYSHIIAWELEHGKIPSGYFVLHKCDNRKCVRVDHLFLGTAQDNADDMVKKGRQATGINNKRFKQFGELHPAHKLSEDQAKKVIKLKREKHQTKEIAQRFGISRSHVVNILSGHSWPHLSEYASLIGFNQSRYAKPQRKTK